MPARHRRAIPLLLLCLLALPAVARAQAPPTPAPAADTAAPSADTAEPAGPMAPAWLTVPASLPPAWRIQAADDAAVTFTDGEARLALVRQSGSANALLGALGSQLAQELGGEPGVYHVSAGGTWVEGRVIESAGRGGERAVVAARRLKGDHVVTAVARGGKRGRSVGQALAVLERVRFAGDGGPAPYPPLDLEERPDARINPAGLFVTLPAGWKPHLDKKEGVFTLRHESARIRYSKASAADQRALRSGKTVTKAYPGYTVQPLFWTPPGSYRAWELLKREKGAVTAVRHIHLVRWKKLEEWSYHLVVVDDVPPRRGFAHVRSLLRRLKMIP